MEMDEAVEEQLKYAELKKDELKQSLDALSAQSSLSLDVRVKLKAVDAYFECILKMIEKKRDEAVSEIRVRENEVEKRVEEVRVRKEKLRDWRGRFLHEISREEMGLEDWEMEVEKREKRAVEKKDELDRMRDGLRLKEARVGVLRSVILGEIYEEKMRLDEKERSLDSRKMRVEEREKRVVEKEDELDKMRNGLRLKEARVGVLRSVIFGEIYEEKMKLDEKVRSLDSRKVRVEEMERENEQRVMRMEEERTRLEKGICNRRKEMEWRGKRLDHQKKLIDAKVKEVEAKELSLNEEKKAFEKRVAELEMKEKDVCDMKRALNCLVEELETERDENKALREEVLLLTHKNESAMAKSSGSSVKSAEEENLDNQFDIKVVPFTPSATTLNGRTLQMYINDMSCSDESWQDEIMTILQKLSEPEKIVLDAMEGFYPPHLSIDGKQFDAGTVRKTCICLLKTLNNLSTSVNPVLRDEALKLAFEWESKMTVTAEKPLEVMGFLELVMTYGLSKEFNGFELLNMSQIAFGESTPLKLLQDLGCTDTISPSESPPCDANSDLMNTKTSNIGCVSNLLSNNQRLQALKYICEFDLADEFSISTIVDIHINNLKQNSRKLLEEKGNTAAAQKEAAELEIVSLKDLIKCIKTHKLHCRYSPASLNERIAQLERQFYSEKRAAPSMDSNPHASPCTNARPFKKRECMQPDTPNTQRAS